MTFAIAWTVAFLATAIYAGCICALTTREPEPDPELVEYVAERWGKHFRLRRVL
jgi:hypothetical protein